MDKPLPIASAITAELDDVADHLEEEMERQYGQLQASVTQTNEKIDRLENKLSVSLHWRVATVVAVIGLIITVLGFMTGIVRLSLPAASG